VFQVSLEAKTLVKILKTDSGEFELNAELALEHRASKMDFRTGAKRGLAVFNWRRNVGIRNFWYESEGYFVIGDRVEASVRQDFVAWSLPRVSYIEICRRAVRRSPDRAAGGIRSVVAAHVGGRMEGLYALERLVAYEVCESTKAEISILKSGGREDKSPRLDSLIFRKCKLYAQV